MKQRTDLICHFCKKDYIYKEEWGKDSFGIKQWRYSCNFCGFVEIQKRVD